LGKFKRDRETFTSTLRALNFFTGKSSEKRVENDSIQKRVEDRFKRKLQDRVGIRSSQEQFIGFQSETGKTGNFMRSTPMAWNVHVVE
jgi:hypothetical protein